MGNLSRVLDSCGVKIYKKEFLPKGVDWLWDLQRLTEQNNMSTFIDVGANCGQTALAVHSRFPSAVIHSFEPVAETFAQLKANVANIPQIIPVHKAVGESSGHITFHVDQLSVLNRPATQKEIESGTALQQVEVITLGEYCTQAGLSKIDVLKTDTEGHDIEVINSILPIVDELRVKFVISEVTFTREPLHTYFPDVNELLMSVGFTLYGLYNYWHQENGSILYCDAMWVRL